MNPAIFLLSYMLIGLFCGRLAWLSDKTDAHRDAVVSSVIGFIWPLWVFWNCVCLTVKLVFVLADFVHTITTRTTTAWKVKK